MLCIIKLFTDIRIHLNNLKVQAEAGPTEYFKTVEHFVNFLYKVVTMKRFWWNSQKYLEILKALQGMTQLSGYPTASV